MSKLKKGPLTRPTGDLSHKGRGVLTHDQPFTSPVILRGRASKDTSPLVGEVARRAGEGSLFKFIKHLCTLRW